MEFRREAALKGLHPDVPSTEGMAMEYSDNYASSSYLMDMADQLDQYVEELIEKYGSQYEPFIRALYEDFRKPMEAEQNRVRSNTLFRIVLWLIHDEKGNLKARLHALLHSVPRLAVESGYPSMRSSAKTCGVSPEWLRRKRDSLCDLLELERPTGGIKSEEAKIKYRHNALRNHWRTQKFRFIRNGSNGHQPI